MPVEQANMTKLTLREDTPTYHCPKVPAPPAVDGNPDDPAWQIGPPVRLVLTQTGDPASKETIVRMCWDDGYLYISYACEDQDVWSTYTERDDPIFNEEVCEAFLCPHGDLSNYFEINVSPRNVVFDSTIFIPGHPTGRSDAGWNCEGLRTAVRVDGTLDCRTDIDRAWYAQMAIPFVAVGRATPQPGEQWRANFYRIERTPLEFQAWSPTYVDPPSFHVPARFGTIVF